MPQWWERTTPKYFKAEFEHSPHEWGTQEWLDDERKRYNEYVVGLRMPAKGRMTEAEWLKADAVAKAGRAEFNQYGKQALAWRAHQDESKQEILPAFQNQFEQAAGRALGGTMRGEALRASRAGLGRGGLGGRGMAQAESQVRGAAAMAYMDASSKFLQQQSAERGQFIMQGTEFENQMSLMQQSARLQQDMEMAMAKFQAQLQADLQSRNAFYDVAGAIGGFLGMGLPTGWLGPLIGIGGSSNE